MNDPKMFLHDDGTIYVPLSEWESAAAKISLLREENARLRTELAALTNATPGETTYDKPEDPAMVAALAEVEKMLGRKADTREVTAIADRVCEVKAIGDIECDGAKVPAWKVYAACLAYCRDVVKINSSVKGLVGYAMKVLETCQRNKLGPGKRERVIYRDETVLPEDNTLEQRLADRLAKRKGGSR